VHLLFEFVLEHSSWTWIQIAFAETYEALIDGIQNACWELKGSPEFVRSDNLSAATHELRETGGRTLTQRYRSFLDHYGMKSIRITPGESHENGVVEQRHRRTKNALAQALVIRGSKDFERIEEYLAWARAVVERSHNAECAAKLAEDRAALRPLPSSRVPIYTIYRPTVRRWSTIVVNKRTYSVASRLIGHEVEARQYPDHVEVWFANTLVEKMPRVRGEYCASINYRHVIWSLVKKPGAFAAYRYREELFPSLIFRRAYDALRSRSERADVDYVRILHLAASTTETAVEVALELLLEAGAPFDYLAVKALAQPESAAAPDVQIGAPDLAQYDALLERGVA